MSLSMLRGGVVQMALSAALPLGCGSGATLEGTQVRQSGVAKAEMGAKRHAADHSSPAGKPITSHQSPPIARLSPALLREHTRALSDDSMQGRRPGTKGARKATEYIVETMKRLGLAPAGSDGYRQEVKMRAIRVDRDDVQISLVSGDKSEPLSFATQIVGASFGPAGDHTIDAPLVFAGYGVTAPAFDWDDYADLDVRGKVVVVFVGDPPVTDGRFGGEAMTYYGRWSYKFERALEAGAAGCLVIHEQQPASYGWNVVENSWSGERFGVVRSDGKLDPALSLQGWISEQAAEMLAKRVGASLETWHAQALSPGFAASDLGVSLQARFTTMERQLADANIVGKLVGSENPNEAIMVTAHWDHLGTSEVEAGKGDGIFNGAIDNASGVAGMLGAAAELKARLNEGSLALKRSVIFLATTAEEQGLLGSKYYAANPIAPLQNLLGVVNLDSMNVHGKTTELVVIGPGQTTLEDTLAEIATIQGRTIAADEHPGSGGYYRSDHFSFAKRGVPAIYFRGGSQLRDGSPEASRIIAETRARHYHTPADEFDPAWSFAGTEQDALTVVELVSRVANAPTRPRWKPTSEFAKIVR